jgi:hypothetical protein
MVTLQNIPEELKAFIKQDGLAWSKKFVGNYQMTTQSCLPDAAVLTLVVQAGREMSIGDSFESTLDGITIVPKRNIAVLKQGISGCFYDAVCARKVGVRAIPIGRLIMLSC